MQHLRRFLLFFIYLMLFSACVPSAPGGSTGASPEILPSAKPTLTATYETLNTVTSVPTVVDTPTEKPITEPPTLSPTPMTFSLGTPGDFSSEILIIEKQLQELGYSETGLADGIFDSQTVLAVEHLQWLNDLPITGAVNPDLFLRLKKGDLASAAWPPPFPAKSISQFSAPSFSDGFLVGQLVNLGYLDDSGENFNPYTIDVNADLAIKAFQKQNDLTGNGIVDFNVWRKLFHPSVNDSSGEPLLSQPENKKWETAFYPLLLDPFDVVFDGKYLWVMHSSSKDVFDNLLMRVDPQKGLLEQYPPVMVGDFDAEDNAVTEMLYDGKRLWLLLPKSGASPELISVIPESGETFIHSQIVEGVQAYFPASALGFDGSKLWATVMDQAWAVNRNNGKGYMSQTLGWLSFGEMAFDGKCMWMGGEVGLVAFHTGGTYPCPGSEEAYALPSGPVVFDGRRIWVAGESWDAVFWLDTKTGFIGDPIYVGSKPSALVFDGEILWVANQGDDTVQGIDVGSGSVGPALMTGSQPVALAHDGQSLWVVNAGDRTLQAIDVSGYTIEIIQPTETPIPANTPTSQATLTPTVPTLERNLYLTTPRMEGDDVLVLQQRLLFLGYTGVGEADGFFGPKTDEAVRLFQSQNGLVVDGIVGPLTWEALFSPTAKGPS